MGPVGTWDWGLGFGHGNSSSLGISNQTRSYYLEWCYDFQGATDVSVASWGHCAESSAQAGKLRKNLGHHCKPGFTTNWPRSLHCDVECSKNSRQSSVFIQINRFGEMATNLTWRKIFLIVTFVRAPVFGWHQETTSQLEFNSGNGSFDSVKIWCPADVRAFAGYPSKDCPTPSHYYKCIDQQAFVDVCNHSESYDPNLNGCSQSSHQQRQKRALEKSSVSSDTYLEQDALGKPSN